MKRGSIEISKSSDSERRNNCTNESEVGRTMSKAADSITETNALMQPEQGLQIDDATSTCVTSDTLVNSDDDGSNIKDEADVIVIPDEEENATKPLDFLLNNSCHVYTTEVEWQITKNDIREPSSYSLELSQKIFNNFRFELPVRCIRIGSLQGESVAPIQFLSWSGLNFSLTACDRLIKFKLDRDDIKYCCAYMSENLSILFFRTSVRFNQLARSHLSMHDYKQDPYFDPDGVDERHKRIMMVLASLPSPKLSKAEAFLISFFKMIKQTNCRDANFRFITEQKAKELYGMSLEGTSERRSTGHRVLVYPRSGRGKIMLSDTDLLHLCERECLNDTVIGFYLRYLYEEVLTDEDREKTYVYDSLFYFKLTKFEDSKASPAVRRYERVKKWTNKVNIFEKDFLVMPINQNSHWYLVIVCFPYNVIGKKQMERSKSLNWKPVIEPSPQTPSEELHSHSKKMKTPKSDEAEVEDALDEADYDGEDINETRAMPLCEDAEKPPLILVFDSLDGRPRYKVVPTIRQYLQMEWNTKQPIPKEFTKETIVGHRVRAPLQTNLFDCGVYMLQNFEFFFKSKIQNFALPIDRSNLYDANDIRWKRTEIRRLIFALKEKFESME